MTTTPYIRVPTFDELADIHSCLTQFTKKNEFPKDCEFYIIQVWFPEPAKKILKNDTPDEQYCIRFKASHMFGNQDIKNHAQEIWDAGMTPIEIISDCTGGLFYALPRYMVLTNTFSRTFFLLCEDKIPTIGDFENVTVQDNVK